MQVQVQHFAAQLQQPLLPSRPPALSQPPLHASYPTIRLEAARSKAFDAAHTTASLLSGRPLVASRASLAASRPQTVVGFRSTGGHGGSRPRLVRERPRTVSTGGEGVEVSALLLVSESESWPVL